jgi:hypothetical protein
VTETIVFKALIANMREPDRLYHECEWRERHPLPRVDAGRRKDPWENADPVGLVASEYGRGPAQDDSNASSKDAAEEASLPFLLSFPQQDPQPGPAPTAVQSDERSSRDDY